MVPLVKVHFQRDRSRRAKSLASSSWQKAVPSNDGVNIDMYIIYLILRILDKLTNLLSNNFTKKHL